MLLTLSANRVSWMALAFLVSGVTLIALQLGGQTERIGEYLIVSAVTLSTVSKKEK